MRIHKFNCLLYLFVVLNLITSTAAAAIATSIFATGCFWCSQSDFEHVPGVLSTVVGYTGGKLKNPTYAQVSNGGTGHYEAIQVMYDPERISYANLLNAFWHFIDPTDATGQFCDKGDQYRSVIFYNTLAEKKEAESSKAQLEKTGKVSQIATQILPASEFYPAEEYHQHYYQKNPLRYKFYRYSCGRDARLDEVWGKNRENP